MLQEDEQFAMAPHQHAIQNPGLLQVSAMHNFDRLGTSSEYNH